MKIISFSFWGNNPKYTIGAVKNAELAKTIYPDWICRYYIGKSVPVDIVDKLKSMDNTQVIEMDEDGDWLGMFWRFYPASDADVEAMLSRDCDSRLNMREKLAVDEWMNSDNSFHIMRDHPRHGVPILGGMWGVKYPMLRKMKNLIENYAKKSYWQIDQEFLRDKIYPIVQHNAMVHDDFFEKKPFPAPREEKQFVGEPFDANDKPDNELRNEIK